MRRSRAVPIQIRLPDRSKKCLICGIDFKPKRRFSAKYCSKDCARLAVLKKQRIHRQTKEAKEKYRKYTKMRRKTDPYYRLKRLVGRAVWGAIKKLGKEKNGSVFKFLPYSPAQLKVHLEGFFNNANGFTWENHGSVWHIDHVIPQDMFRYTTMDSKEFRDCWALSNLMPVTKSFNYSKNCRFVGSLDDFGQLKFSSL